MLLHYHIWDNTITYICFFMYITPRFSRYIVGATMVYCECNETLLRKTGRVGGVLPGWGDALFFVSYVHVKM